MKKQEEEKPPILGSWKKMYLAILVIHAIVLFIFWLFTQHYA